MIRKSMKLGRKSIAACILWTSLLAIIGVPLASAQSGCMTGDVSYLGVNGIIKICPQYDSKVPEMQKQMAGMQQTVNGNQALLREVAQAVRNINALGRNVDDSRKTELLRSFGKQLQEIVSADQAKTQAQLASLNDKLDSLKDLLSEKREDDKTSAQTRAALKGQLGDAIAALDLTQAQQQLDSIQAKLETIGHDVETTRENTEVIRKDLEAHNKSAFAQVSVEAWAAGIVWEFRVHAVPPASQYDPKVRVVMLNIIGGTVRTVRKAVAGELPLSQFPNTYRTQINELGGQVVVCYTAHAEGQSSAQRLTSIFKTEFNAGKPVFVLTQEPTLEPASDAPCGGQQIAQTFREQADAGVKEEAMTKPVPAFTHPPDPKDAAGTYYDVRTGAMWTPSDADNAMDYYTARQYCTDLKLADHDDWRLPTIDELRALYDPTRPQVPRNADSMNSPVWIRGGIQLGGYSVWSGTQGQSTIKTVEAFNFQSGTSFGGHVGLRMADAINRVLCVRGQPTWLPLLVNTYADPATGLIWTATDDGFYMEIITAQGYCRGLKLAGFQDWRLPRIEELQTLYDPAHPRIPRTRDTSDPRVYIRDPIELSGYSVWSNTADAHSNGDLRPSAMPAYSFTNESFNFQTGKVEHDMRGDLRALCVRGKQPQ